MSSTRSKLLALGAVVALAVVGSLGYLRLAAERSPATSTSAAAATPGTAAQLGAVQAGPHIVFRSTALDTFGRVAMVPLTSPTAEPVVTGTACERVYAVRRMAVCMWADRGVLTTYRAHLLGPDLRRVRELPLAGLPSRARLSRDGATAATTTFVTGHSYAQAGFSTATTLYDTATGRALANLEEFALVKDGRPYRSADVNIWGVTFAADGGRFYATVATKGRTYLGVGDVTRRRLVVVGADVECPSLSPDGTRVAYKKRTGAPGQWRLHVRDLRTGTDRALSERRSVDDQVEWLDDEHVLYGLPRGAGTAATDVWVAPVAGGQPRVLIPEAWSPAVVR